jgi:hypothetical protein
MPSLPSGPPIPPRPPPPSASGPPTPRRPPPSPSAPPTPGSARAPQTPGRRRPRRPALAAAAATIALLAAAALAALALTRAGLGLLPPPAAWRIPYDPAVPIPPRVISSFPRLGAVAPPRVAGFAAAWRVCDPTLEEVIIYDDAGAEAYVKKHMGAAVAARLRSLPLGAMRADLFRLAAVYFGGGVWADADVECRRPLGEWLDPPPGDADDEAAAAAARASSDGRNATRAWADCGLVVGLEHARAFFAQWTFAAAPGHPALAAALEEALARTEPVALAAAIAAGPEFALHTTGPDAFTAGVLAALGFPGRAGGRPGAPRPRAGELVDAVRDEPDWAAAVNAQRACLGDVELFASEANVAHAAMSFQKGGWGLGTGSWRERGEAMHAAARGGAVPAQRRRRRRGLLDYAAIAPPGY